MTVGNAHRELKRFYRRKGYLCGVADFGVVVIVAIKKNVVELVYIRPHNALGPVDDETTFLRDIVPSLHGVKKYFFERDGAGVRFRDAVTNKVVMVMSHAEYKKITE
jgi:hypothetical protein